MAKTRRKAMPNSTAIDILKAKCKIKDNSGEVTNKYSTVWKDNKGWYGIKRAMRGIYEYSWMVPIDIWKLHVNKRFKAEFPLGRMVRINQNSRRARVRNGFNQNVGVSQSFRHLGIGSGKQYLTDRMKEAQANLYRWNTHYNAVQEGTQIVIGHRYASNIIAAVNHAKYCNSIGMKVSRWKYGGLEDVRPTDFMEYTNITADGIFGPKRLINGYVTQVYVHFLEPKWNTKRECRYEITFDNGVRGIWTNDYMERVYDTDYELDEHLMDGCPHSANCRTTCDHREVHFHNEECDTACFKRQLHVCKTIYDYTNFFDTTHKVGMELKDDKA
jgi:hypothetical protein